MRGSIGLQPSKRRLIDNLVARRQISLKIACALYFGRYKKFLRQSESNLRANMYSVQKNYRRAGKLHLIDCTKMWYTAEEGKTMQIKSVTVKNYRNLTQQKISLGSGLNVFVGDNAQGKTNLLESVYLCCIGKSPRTDKDKDLIRWGETVAHVKTEYNCRYGDGEISVGIAGNKKHISVNSVPIAKLGDLLGYLNCIYFSPQDIKIVSQSPAERRKFMDMDLCQMDKNYFYGLQKFNKALAQRNNMLKQNREISQAKDTLFIWDGQIAEEGAKLVMKRRAFCESLKAFAKRSHRKLSVGKEELVLEYQTQISGETFAELTDNYAKLLENSLEQDCRLGYTSVGCQRDDISIAIGNADVRNFGSQGQQRTAALALKLAELAIFKEQIGEYPVLLLDDVLSELDAERQKQLLSFSKFTQVLLTTACKINDLTSGMDLTEYVIEGGKATPSGK
ncbi:MAG: DNA replication/repair protein RecF [Corallococcus sp.]|nr:DNA replication/repair protein RecF [Corallococcus sp.]